MKMATKTILKSVLTAVFVPLAIYQIYRLVIDFKTRGADLAVEGSFGIVFALVFFVFAIFAWIAPKTLFNLCWKMSKFMPETYDYETGLTNMSSFSLGCLIFSVIFLGIGFLFVPI